MDDTLEKAVREFVAQERGMKLAEIRLDLALMRDLEMDGDDAVEFFEMYAEQFKVNLDGIRWDCHFGSEGCNPFSLLMPSVWKRKWTEISVQDLVDAARAGHWTMKYED